MKAHFRSLLLGIAALTYFLSFYPLFWWSLGAYGLLTGNSAVGMAKKLAPHLLVQGGQPNIVLMQTFEYFFYAGGLIGWISLFTLGFLYNRNFNDLPKWVAAGCLIGVFASITPIFGNALAIFPIVTASALLLRSYLAKEQA